MTVDNMPVDSFLITGEGVVFLRFWTFSSSKIVCSGKSEAEVTIIKVCTVEANY